MTFIKQSPYKSLRKSHDDTPISRAGRQSEKGIESAAVLIPSGIS